MKMKGTTGLGIWMFVFAVCFSCDTARNVEDPNLHYFVKYYGADGNQQGVDMLPLSDGSFLLLGNYRFDNESDVYAIRVDAAGEIIWEKRFNSGTAGPGGSPGGYVYSAKDVEYTSDGNLIILADVLLAAGSTNSQCELIKISPDGDRLGSMIFGTPANEFARSVTPLADGGFVVSGTSELTRSWQNPDDPDPDRGDTFNYRFDASLNEVPQNQWSPIRPGFNATLDVAVKAFQRLVPEEQYYVFGYSNINLFDNNPDKKLGLFYFLRGSTGSESGNFFPGNTIDGRDREVQFVTREAPALGGGYIVVGTSRINQGSSKIFFATLRENLLFSRDGRDLVFYTDLAIDGNVRGVAAANSLVGKQGYIVLGDQVRSTGATNIWLTKINQSGDSEWDATFGSETENDSGAAVHELPDGRILVFGTMGLADNQQKMALIKLSPDGLLLK